MFTCDKKQVSMGNILTAVLRNIATYTSIYIVMVHDWKTTVLGFGIWKLRKLEISKILSNHTFFRLKRYQKILRKCILWRLLKA